MPMIGAFRWSRAVPPYPCASPNARTLPIASTTQYPLPDGVGANATYGFVGGEVGGWPKERTLPNGSTLPLLDSVQNPRPALVLGCGVGLPGTQARPSAPPPCGTRSDQ